MWWGVGKGLESEMRSRRLPHRCTYLLVFNRHGELFWHLRTSTKDVFPGYWDLTIGGVLAALTREDARFVFKAIRLANPGGLGRVESEDVAAEPSVTLLEAMRLAANRDRIAEQYANNFATVLAGAERLREGQWFRRRWEEVRGDRRRALGPGRSDPDRGADGRGAGPDD